MSSCKILESLKQKDCLLPIVISKKKGSPCYIGPLPNPSPKSETAFLRECIAKVKLRSFDFLAKSSIPDHVRKNKMLKKKK
jgi:hypothetical protein